MADETTAGKEFFGQILIWGGIVSDNLQQTRVYPYPLGAGSARPNPKMGDAQRGTETMVLDHGLGRGQTMG